MNSAIYEKELARAYYKLLTTLDWKDEILIEGLREGLNKFLSNAFKGRKHLKSHFVSRSALEQLQCNDFTELVFEHLIPKSKYIQKPCEEKAIQGTLTVEYIEDLLQKFWYFAIITKKEDSLLTRFRMPEDWDENDIFARYKVAGIELVKNPFLLDSYLKD